MMKGLALDAKHGMRTMLEIEAGHCSSIIFARARRSCYAFAGWDSLAKARSV